MFCESSVKNSQPFVNQKGRATVYAGFLSSSLRVSSLYVRYPRPSSLRQLTEVGPALDESEAR